MTKASTPKAKGAKAPRAPRPPSAKARAAGAFRAAFGKDPPKRMTAKAMEGAVTMARVSAGRQASRAVQVEGIFGTQPSQAAADAAAAKARANFDAKLAAANGAKAQRAASRMSADVARIAQQDAMMDRLLSGEKRLAEIADRRSGKVQNAKSALPVAASVAMAPKTSGSIPSSRALVPAPSAAVPSAATSRPAAARAYSAGMTALGVASIGWNAVGAYNRARDPDAIGGNKTRSDALIEAGKAAAPGVGLAALGIVSKTAGRAILPAMAAWSAYQGAKEDTGSALRGAGRGVVRALDPTQIFMSRGLGERAYDRMFGAAPKPEAPSFWQQMFTPRQAPSFVRGASMSPPTASGQVQAATDAARQKIASGAGGSGAGARAPKPQREAKRPDGFTDAHVRQVRKAGGGVQTIRVAEYRTPRA